MADIVINGEVMRNAASGLTDIGQKVQTLTDEAIGIAETLTGDPWVSDAANAFIAKFKTTRTTFEQKVEDINKYAAALNDFAQKWEDTEVTIANQVEQIQIPCSSARSLLKGRLRVLRSPKSKHVGEEKHEIEIENRSFVSCLRAVCRDGVCCRNDGDDQPDFAAESRHSCVF